MRKIESGAHAAQDALGHYGEGLAARMLVDAGLRILDRNWRCPVGEIDIVAAEGPTLIICEVKTRSSLRYGAPLEAVNWRKVQRLHVLGNRWAATHHWPGKIIRIDVVAILVPRTGRAQLQHVRGVA